MVLPKVTEDSLGSTNFGVILLLCLFSAGRGIVKSGPDRTQVHPNVDCVISIKIEKINIL